MKFLKNLSLPAFLGLLAMSAYHKVDAQSYTDLQQDLITTLVLEYPKKINLHIANLKKIPTTLSVVALDGRLWYEEVIERQNGYGKKLNLKKLPIGFYYLLVEHKEQKIRYYFTIDREQLGLFPPESSQKKSLTYQKEKTRV